MRVIISTSQSVYEPILILQSERIYTKAAIRIPHVFARIALAQNKSGIAASRPLFHSSLLIVPDDDGSPLITRRDLSTRRLSLASRAPPHEIARGNVLPTLE